MINLKSSLLSNINSFGVEFQTTYFNKLRLGKTIICKVERLNIKQRRSRWLIESSHLDLFLIIFAVCKSLFLSPVAVKEVMKFRSLLSDYIIIYFCHNVRKCTFGQDSDQHAHSHSLISIFTGHILNS